ncbi:GNAT family N-acetyltransferase [Egicoccus sp. AB-alg6-2]|uniref:GNAT family N-acetyltransferase n=1 Tax=Egicoccus sp. AB-alg6-2 TaxID=3242692 RepID=UPI00359E63DB
MLHLESDPDDVAAVAEFMAAQQADPTHHIGYLGLDAEPIRLQLQGLEPLGTAGLSVARDGSRIVGALAAEWDTDPPRCWWHGPFVAPDADATAVSDALLAHGRERLPDEVTQEETCGDERHAWLSDFAARNGFHAEEASAVLGRSLTGGLPPRTVATVAGEELTEQQRNDVAALHDALFANTHTPGHKLVAGGDRRLLVVIQEGRAVGYAAVERQEDGAGYLDFLGVAPEVQGRGLGSALVAAACHELRDILGCEVTDLTVRVGNAAARKVYTNNGFVEERILVPFRKGMALP